MLVSHTPQNKTYYWTNLPKEQKYLQTVEVYKWLKENRYFPADMDCGIITLRKPQFIKLIKDLNTKVAVLERRYINLFSIWINSVEVCYQDPWPVNEWHTAEPDEIIERLEKCSY